MSRIKSCIYTQIVSLLPFVLLVLVLILSACNTSETDLDFRTIEQTEFHGSKYYEDPDPNLSFVTQKSETVLVSKWFTQEVERKLWRLNYNRYFALAVFQGWKSQYGYGVQINSVVRAEDTVYIFADFTEHEPDRPYPDAASSPYHLIQVRKSGAWDRTITFNLVANGTLLMSKEQFIP